MLKFHMKELLSHGRNLLYQCDRRDPYARSLPVGEDFNVYQGDVSFGFQHGFGKSRYDLGGILVHVDRVATLKFTLFEEEIEWFHHSPKLEEVIRQAALKLISGAREKERDREAARRAGEKKEEDRLNAFRNKYGVGDTPQSAPPPVLSPELRSLEQRIQAAKQKYKLPA